MSQIFYLALVGQSLLLDVWEQSFKLRVSGLLYPLEYFSSFNDLNLQQLLSFDNILCFLTIHQIYIYVMKSHSQHDKSSSHDRRCSRKNKSPSTSKSRSKHKKKQKSSKFNPINYLNGLIDLQNNNYNISKNKIVVKRDITSALTIATPILETTQPSTKVRSKSSYSQHRKKSSHPKKPIQINFPYAITEEDNVRFSENTMFSSKNSSVHIRIPEKSENACAILIQRAWRNYQTYKMVNQHYIKAKTSQKQRKVPKSQIELDKTLKIKLSYSEVKQQQDFYETSKEYNFKEKQIQSKELVESKIQSQFILNSSDQLISELKEQQAERWEEVMDMIEKSNKQQNKQIILARLIQKFEQNKQHLQHQIKKQLENAPPQNNQASSSQVSDLLRLQSLQEVREQERVSEEYQRTQIKLIQCVSQQNSQQSIDKGQIFYPQIRIFNERLKLLDTKRKMKVQKLGKELQLQSISFQEYSHRKQRIINKIQAEKKSVQKKRKEYIFSMREVKKSALHFFHQSSQLEKEKKAQKSLRNCFSCQNLVIKSVLKEIQNFQFLEKFEGSVNLDWPLTPPKNTPEQSRVQDTDIKPNTQTMKAYSEELESEIEYHLIQQFIQEAYLNEKVYEFFRPFVEEMYTFKRISDSDILSFVSDAIPKFYPSSEQLLIRLNQKVNPTSFEILKIIRDLDFQMEQYDLVLPEESFKDYRAKIQREHQLKSPIKQMSELPNNLPQQIKVLVISRENNKCQKINKYRNFERDLRIMYMKAVFNCLNQFLIEAKSTHAFMNSRSSIGPGELKLAIKQYNTDFSSQNMSQLFIQVQVKLKQLLNSKCIIPSLKNYHELQIFQRQIMDQIQKEYTQLEYKWVNYMDEVLEIWHEISIMVIDSIFEETSRDIYNFF